MQERKFVISRVIKSERLFPTIKKSAKQRVEEFVVAQKQVVAYPFSLELSIKALGQPIKNSKDPSADNKEKRKKSDGKFKRYGTAIFDPNAKAKPGQYFEVRARKINQDGQLGDVANIGWLDKRKTVAPNDFVKKGTSYLETTKNISIRKVPAKKNPRTGALEVKALGASIGRSTGNIGQAAARGIGIIVDAGGKFRCPPGVPAANQFTDEVGSNCFDFSPLVARKLVEIAQKFGQSLQATLTQINNASPFERDEDYKIVPKGQGAPRMGRGLRSSGGILGPDGKPISMEALAARDMDAELAAAEADFAKITSATSRVIDPDTYETEFENAFRKAFPDEPDSSIKEMAKVAASRERVRDKLRKEQKQAIEIIRSLGIEVDERSPSSIQRALGMALVKMRDEGWGVELSGYYGDDINSNPELALLKHQQKIADLAFQGIEDAVKRGMFDGLSFEELAALRKKYPQLQKEIMQAVLEGRSPSDVYPDDPKAQLLMALVINANVKATQFENGAFMQLVNARRNSPELVGNLESIELAEHDPKDPFFAEMGLTDNGGTKLIMNLHGMLLTHPPESLNEADNYLYEPASTAGTEIEKLKRIGEVVTEANRAKLLGSYLDNLGSFGQNIKSIQSGDKFLTETVNGSFGGTALGQFVLVHELTHSRQLLLAREVILARNPGMTNAEAMNLVSQIILEGMDLYPEGMSFDYGTMMGDPRVMSTAAGNMGEIIAILIDNRVAGAYGPSHYFTTFYLNEALQKSNSIRDLRQMQFQMEQRRRMLIAGGASLDSSEVNGLQVAINKVLKVIETTDADADALRDLKKLVSREAQVTYMEMQADISAAVQLGLIEETPEIKIFLAPLSLDGDLPEIRKTIIPPPPPGPPPTRREKIKKLARIAKNIKNTKLGDIADIYEQYARQQDIDDALALSLSDRDRGLMSTGLASAVRFDGRGSASRWGKNVRSVILDDATPEQVKVIEDSKWRNSPDLKDKSYTSDEYAMRLRLLLGGANDEWLADSFDETFIPFVEVIDESKLPNSIAAEIIIPGEALRSGSAISVDTHFTGVLKDDGSLGSVPGQNSFAEGQRLIVNVPEGYSGLPDYTPGSNKSEVGSIILPPGEIEIIGLRDDGVAIGRVVSQINADDLLEAKKQELRSFDSKTNDLGEKITIRKAINRLERKQERRSTAALRSSNSVAAPSTEIDKRSIPSDTSPRTRDILERLKAKEIKFGRISPKRREEKRKEVLEKLRQKNSGSNSVKMDSRKFESPDESAIRVSNSIGDALGLIEQGKLEGLAPEVAEIMKGKSPEEIREILIGSAKDFVEGLDKRPRFRIRSTPVRDVKDSREIPFMGFLKTGVYKTTYDADSVGVAAASLPEERREYEEMLGIPELEDSSLRPAHGFLTHQDQIEFEDKWKQGEIDAAEKRSPNAVSFRDLSVIPPPSGSNNSAKDSDGNLRQINAVPYQYGDTEIILRTDSAARSVGTMGDSFNGHRTPIALDGSSTDDELLEAMILNRGIALEKYGAAASSQRRIANLLNASVGKNHSQTTDFSRPGDDTKRDYVEAIVAGSFNMSDVEEIKISSDFQDAQIRALTKVDAKEVSEKHTRELLTGVLPPDDFTAMHELISDKSTDPQIKKATQELRELVAARLSLIKERSGRRDIRRQVAQRSSGETSPKVTFMNRDGINIDDPRTFSRTATAVGMSENHEIDDVVKYGTARAVRDILERSGKAISSKESFAALKPKEVETPQIGLRSSGATRSRDDVLREILNPSGGLRSSGSGRTSRTAEILSRAKEKGIDIDRYERDVMPKILRDKKSGSTALTMSPSDRFPNGYKGRLEQAVKDAAEQGDDAKTEIIKQLIQDIEKMSPDELNLAVEDALKRLPPQFSQNISVQVSDPIRVINSDRYMTVHDVDDMKKAGVRGLSERMGFDPLFTSNPRKAQELNYLGIPYDDDSESTRKLRPASGFVTSTISEKRRVSTLKKKYGEDVEIQHPYAVGAAARADNADMSQYGGSRIILRSDVAERSLVFQGDSVTNTGSRSPAVKLSTIEASPYRDSYFNPASILYADRTGDMDSVASPAANLLKNGKGEAVYQEAMILGSFGDQDIAAVVVSPAEIRTTMGRFSSVGVNPQSDQNVTSIIEAAQKREELAERGIDLVLDSRLLPLDEVEPFNPQMTRIWVQGKIDSGDWKDVTVEELVPDDKTTPYEAFLRRYEKAHGVGTGRTFMLFDHPDNEPGNDEKNKANLTSMINKELERLDAAKAKRSDGALRSAGRGEVATPTDRRLARRTSRGDRFTELFNQPDQRPTDGTIGYNPIVDTAARERSAELARQVRQSLERLRSSGARSVLVEGEGGRSSFRTRRSGASLRSSGATRTTREKIENGPTELPNGRGADGTPRAMDIESAKTKFGKSPREVRRYFKKEYGVKVEIASLPDDADASEVRSTYGAVQALDDLFVNTPGLGELVKRDSVEIRVGPDDFSKNMGGFRPKSKFFTKTKIGKKGAKTEIMINTATIGDKSLSSLNNFASSFNGRNQSGREENLIAYLYARAAIPDRFEVAFPGEDSPDYENWKKVSGDVQQRIAYAATVHEFAHYLDFSQREKSDASIPPWRLHMLNYGKEKQPVSRDAFLSSGSGLSSVDGAQSVSTYGLTETTEKFAEAFTAWWLLSGTDTYTQPQGMRGARSAYSAQEEFRAAIAEAVTPLLDKLGPRVKSAKSSENRTTVETTKIPDVAIIYAISPYMDMLNKNKKRSGKIKPRPTGSANRKTVSAKRN